MIDLAPSPLHHLNFYVFFLGRVFALSEEIHGIDTLIGAVSTYECGKKCPPANKRRAYFAFLDSLPYSNVERCVRRVGIGRSARQPFGDDQRTTKIRIASMFALKAPSHTHGLLL